MVVAVIQARMGASRLPGKVLLPLLIENAEQTVLSQVCRRVRMAQCVQRVVVATTDSALDDPIAEWVSGSSYTLFRGSEADVLSRYYHAALENGAETVIRITADCPCVDPAVISAMLQAYMDSGADYLSNTLQRTFPHGLDVEIFSFQALERAYKEGVNKFEREHVTPYLYKSGKFNCVNYSNPQYITGAEDIRVTLDTPQDYIAIAALYSLLGADFDCEAICKAFDKYIWLKMINASIIQKKLYDSFEDEISDAIAFLRKQDMPRAADALQASMRNGGDSVK